jgi:hypothetical protein
MISAHRTALESLFESNLFGVSYPGKWPGALKILGVTTTDLGGYPLKPTLVLQSTIVNLVRVRNDAERERLEYVLFGDALSLPDRRQFDSYCSAGEP